MPQLLAVLLAWLPALLGCWLVYQLLRQSGRILVRLDALEERLRQLAETGGPIAGHASAAPSIPGGGLPRGSPAAEFELPDLEGKRRRLSDFRGRPVLLVFFHPGCGFCRLMAPDLVALPTTPEARPQLLVVTAGDAQETRTLFGDGPLPFPALIQEGAELSSIYQTHGTPTGYLIDAEGRLASGLVVGAEALLELALEKAPEQPPAAPNGRAAYGSRDLSRSRINRNGLPRGAPAPDFRLPLVNGGEVSLQALRGRRLLLVFVDPQCTPCDALVPELEALQAHRPELQLLLISRGDAEENREKARKHGLSIPVALQRKWEVSRAYATFATPAGYLIDEAGLIAAEPAAGVEPILALAAAGSPAGPPAGR